MKKLYFVLVILTITLHSMWAQSQTPDTSTCLSGMEPRIEAAVIGGWMTSLPTTVDISYRVHRDMFDPFGVHANLDHPDIATLGAPDCATFVQNCARDRLFTREGMDAAVEKIRAVYVDQKKPEKFKAQYYDVPHQFNIEMQEDAFAARAMVKKF